jgi:hypothetical protein
MMALYENSLAKELFLPRKTRIKNRVKATQYVKEFNLKCQNKMRVTKCYPKRIREKHNFAKCDYEKVYSTKTMYFPAKPFLCLSVGRW